MPLTLIALLLLPTDVLAHSPLGGSDQERLSNGLGALVLFVFWLGYSTGAFRVRPALTRWLLFQGATLIAVVSVLGPLDELAETSAAAHMTQHMLMMVVIAPLWVLAQPLPQWAAVGGRPVIRLWTPLLRVVRDPLPAAALHAAVIWVWHAPKLYVLALENPWWHLIEHACFLLTASLFWWSVLRSSPGTAPRTLLALLFTLMHTGFLGALLTFANVPLYGEARSLQSQQLAGLIMWVLGGLPYLAAAFWCGHRWFRQLLRRSVL
ncbi:MAG TPA: cytochrome c oxidase assembly protein [Gammaproteobacteria bacterium]|nr:cytochrome c oxidase assembly protein [Gammaproteobacteria bacterium]